MVVRPAAKAGSWYTKDKNKLSNELQNWLSSSKASINEENIKAIICPHAGYVYCGSTGAYSYKHINPSRIKRIFILGPDHSGIAYNATHNCMLSSATHWQTPFGNISVDIDIIHALQKTNCFDMLSIYDDANEHSLELTVPFLSYMYYSFKQQTTKNESKQNNDNNDNNDIEWNQRFKIIPIMVGHCSKKEHEMYGKILAPYMKDKETLFIISSDFCHWGNNYGYTPYDNKSNKEIFQYIADLDRIGMYHISNLDYENFHKYLNQTKNTICGRHPICILLNTVKALTNADNNDNNDKNDNNDNKNNKNNNGFALKFIDYTQSSKVRAMNDYSVSYASGILYQK